MKSIDLEASRNEAPPDVALIQTALCYLMTRYTLRPCSGLNFTIVHHLQMLLAHPDMARRPERGKVYRELLQHWRSIAMQQQVASSDCALARQPALH
ncbi:MAG: hypothetical protein F9K25_19665 [Candidatus Contendobacter sp.]|nr:MAG: hypothetical protein F9K25_19665 [Candidatus Contendobacter sp.]